MSDRFRQTVRAYTRAAAILMKLDDLTDEEKQQVKAMLERLSTLWKLKQSLTTDGNGDGDGGSRSVGVVQDWYFVGTSWSTIFPHAEQTYLPVSRMSKGYGGTTLPDEPARDSHSSMARSYKVFSPGVIRYPVIHSSSVNRTDK